MHAWPDWRSAYAGRPRAQLVLWACAVLAGAVLMALYVQLLQDHAVRADASRRLLQATAAQRPEAAAAPATSVGVARARKTVSDNVRR